MHAILLCLWDIEENEWTRPSFFPLFLGMCLTGQIFNECDKKLFILASKPGKMYFREIWLVVLGLRCSRSRFVFIPDCVISLDRRINVRDDCDCETIGENTISYILRLVSQITQGRKNVFFQLNADFPLHHRRVNLLNLLS